MFAHLLADAKLLEGRGTVLAIPASTSHYFADRLQAQLHVPIIHVIRETVKTIQAMGKQTVGILATDGTVQTGIYQNELTAAGLTPVTLPEELQKTVMSIIYDEIKKGDRLPRGIRGDRRLPAFRRVRLRHSGLHGAVGLPHPPQPAPLLYRRHGDLGRAGHPPLRQTTAERIRKSLPRGGRWLRSRRMRAT
ncbi:MAG: aspartate/glutamate racemase family protein [Evtepia sp.]